MKKFISVFLILSLIGSLSACSSKKEKITIEEIIEKSDRCVVVSTITPDQNIKTTRVGNFYHTQVYVLCGDLEGLPSSRYITIIQENSNYLKMEKIYAVFINESSENENHFYVTEGKSGAIYIKDKNEFTCLDKSLQKNAEEIFGTTYDDFEEWLFDEYKVERSLVSTENPA